MSDAAPGISGPGITALADRLRRGEVTSARLVADALDRARAGADLNAFISYYEQDALRAAADADARIGAGRARGPLDGIPVAVKDNLYLRGRTTTMGSRIHGDFVPDHTATSVERLAAAGAIVIGKTNLHEYALGLTTDNPYFGTCRNPWNRNRIPGGSSGGSAVAVSTGMVPAALGSDTSGSIRIPAAMCGVVGLKPTYGLVSRHGCFPEAWTLDHVGPLAGCVHDAAILLDAISGWDARDRASLKRAPTRLAARVDGDLTGVTVGVERDFFFDEVDDRVAACVEDALQRLVDHGAVLREVRMPSLRDAVWALTIIDTSETTTVHQENLRTRSGDYGPEVRYLLRCGALPSAVDYLTAQQVREVIRAEVLTELRGVDALLAPSVPLLTPDIGQETTEINGRPADVLDAAMRLVGPANLLGLPSLSVPYDLIDGLPAGVQLIGAPLAEAAVLNVGRAVERLRPEAADRPWRPPGPAMATARGQRMS